MGSIRNLLSGSVFLNIAKALRIVSDYELWHGNMKTLGKHPRSQTICSQTKPVSELQPLIGKGQAGAAMKCIM